MPTQLSLFDLLGAPEPPPPPPTPAPAAPPSSRPVVWVVHGGRAAEALLLEKLSEELDLATRDPRLLARPVRVVVPSRSLTTHLTARLLARRGRSLAGIAFQTLYGAAAEIVERAGEAVPRGTLLFEVLAERAAREEPALVRGLDGLVDGYSGVYGTVRDFLDAGFEGAHEEAVEEVLAGLGPEVASPAAVDRACALVRVAARVEAEGRRLQIGRTSQLLRRATELVAADPERFLPSRALYVHGFGDATGLAADLLTQLLNRPRARILLDRPPDPTAAAAPSPSSPAPEPWESAFTERFAWRLQLTGARFEEARPQTAPAERAPLARLEAAGGEAEIRGVVLRVRALLDAGAAPEGIGIVARDLSPYRLALRRHLGRLGIPFSGLAARGSIDPGGRRAAALLELLRKREETPCDRWLDAALSLPPPSAGEEGERLPLAAAGRRRIDLRLAVRALGAGRLRDLAGLTGETLGRLLRNGFYALPIRQGLKARSAAPEDEVDPEGEGEERGTGDARTAARTVSGAEIERAAAAARALCRRFAGWPDAGPAALHLGRTADLLAQELGWEPEETAGEPVVQALERLHREIPAAFPLRFDDLRLLLSRALVDAGRSPLGGRGGGVQVLSVTEARARTFEHLFLVGMNRDVFPRTVREDPLLPDPLRSLLAGPFRDGVLPDVPVKREGFDEERYLFAQLLSAAPAVTLSWQSTDDDGRPRSASPLVERLLAPGGAERLPALYAVPANRRAPRPADEQAILAGLHGPREGFGAVLPFAVAEGRNLLAPLPPIARPLDPAALAAARLAALDEIDPDRRTPEGREARRRLGPWFGFVGPLATAPAGGGDPRQGDLWITQLEGMAACPWQTFLTRVLKLEPTPDPLEALPGVDALLLGNLVHGVLEAIVLAATPRAWRREGGIPWRERQPVAVAWPEEEVFERLLRETAVRVVEEEGISLPGMARALAERARPYLEVARQVEWAEPPAVLGAEVRTEVEIAPAAGLPSRRLRFKADRIDRVGLPGAPGAPESPGRLRLTDYKTGRPISAAKRPDKQAEHFLAAVRGGTRLQAVAYRLAGGEEALGRYLYLRPDTLRREYAVAGEPELARAFGTAVAAALAAWEAGTFFPRVVDLAGRAEPGRCKFCRVAEACLRGDSGARGRLFDWATAEASREEPGEAELLAVWRLPGSPEEGA